jgi:hypothetical protein
MINLIDGSIVMDNKFILSHMLTFNDFKLSNYYNNQNEIRMIYLDGLQKIKDNNFYMSLYFKNGFLKQIQIMIEDKNITQANESMRKKLHDELLSNFNISTDKNYDWGVITSEYDRKSNSSDIVITYND